MFLHRCARLFFVVCLAMPGRAATQAAGEERLDFFHSLIVRRPVMEQELELQVRRNDSRAGSEMGLTATLDYRLLPRWQLEVATPLIFRDPAGEESVAGVGDLVLQNKVLLLTDPRHRALVATGLDLTLPSGDAGRSLGGRTVVTPFLSIGIAAGPIQLLGDLSYRWSVAGPVRGEEQLTGGFAVGLPRPGWVPFIEATSTTDIRTGRADTDRLGGRALFEVGPGVNVDLAPGRTLLFRIGVPVTGPRPYDYELRLGLVWNF